MQERWGAAPGEAYVHDNAIAFAGLTFGNIFVALQPPRGYGMDPNAIYHTPDLPPTHHYYALYQWLRAESGWNTDAIVHLGKHGTLEWLPGKSVGLSQTCYPDQLLADIPVIYPFIINNPGEGAQSKRRAHAVIIDHLIPPMTNAGAYGALAELAMMVDEYYQLEGLDPSKLPALQRQIWEKITSAHLDEDLKAMLQQDHGDHVHEWDEEVTEDGTPVTLGEMRGKDFAHLLEDIDGYLCELTGAQIRNGLHILGELPTDQKLTDLLFSLCRLPNIEIPGIREALARASGYPLASLLDTPGRRLTQQEQIQFSWLLPFHEQKENGTGTIHSAADALAALENCCRHLLSVIQAQHFTQESIQQSIAELNCPGDTSDIQTVLSFVCEQIMSRLQQVYQEITHILKALQGEFIPAGPSGSPTRGMVHVLPTGRNFYGLDPRAIPSQAAWEVGTRLAHELVERHRKETGRYPESVGISVWGTSALRTQGDDIAQIFALMGVHPRWQAENRRLTGIDVIPLQELGRPRIDVVSRISGFFRDAFPHIIHLLDEAVHLVANLDEPLEQNYIKRHIQADIERYRAAGSSEQESQEIAHYRIFGSKPGAYGAGILPLIDERNWRDITDFAATYVNWGGYAYTRKTFGSDARSAFRNTLSRVVVAAKNQDNREHDIFDSDDYLQFHGGMIATIQALTGKRPARYIGDSADPQNIRVRDLKEETLRVFRSRVVNPKWIAAMRQHGYKGGLELSATMDYLFGYDATSDIMDGWMYERVAQTYVLETETQEFLRQSNPWALRDITTRLFEAAQRGLWKEPDAHTLDALRDVLLQAEADIEQRNE
jgi:cobaltochelatase CobN